MKNNLKRMLPYILINTFIWGIIGALIGKNIVEIHNTSKKLNADNKALEKYLRGLIKQAEDSGKVISLDEFEKIGKGDDRKPIEPTPIYVYD